MVSSHSISIRKACNEVKISRSCYYYQEAPDGDVEIIENLNILAERHPYYGFWKLFSFLRREGKWWNHKRVYRIYRQLGLNLRRSTKKRLPARVKEPLMVPKAPNTCWSIDFMSDRLYSGKRFRTFNVLDDFNREALVIEIDSSLSAFRLIRIFNQLKEWRGLPLEIRMDNGPELIASAFKEWAEENEVGLKYIQPGKPTQNAYIERFNRTYRKEVLNRYLFDSLEEVREITEKWMEEYNCQRPHDSLGRKTPHDLWVQSERKTITSSGMT